jgi:hypothetical protein
MRVTFWTIVTIVFCAIIAGYTYFTFNGVGRGYSEGFRVGVIQKASSKGMLCKSFEGELILKSFGSRVSQQNLTNATISNVWEFSASDPVVIEKIKAAASTGRSVNLEYTQYWIRPYCSYTDYEITGVQLQ